MKRAKSADDIWLRIKTLKLYQDSVASKETISKQKQILMEIAQERITKEQAAAERKIIEDRLDAQTKEYDEAMKAQEIMDQIDAQKAPPPQTTKDA